MRSVSFRSIQLPCATRRKPAAGSDRRQGAALVEFALVAPLFFLFVIGMIEFGRALMVSEMLANAAGYGARYGAVSGTDTASIKTAVSTALTGLKISGATTTVTVNSSATDARLAVTGDVIQVSIAVPYSSVSWLSNASYLAQSTLSVSAVARRE